MELKIANYGQEKELTANPEELELANWIVAYFPDDNLRIVQMTPEYLTVKRGDWDIVRIKYTERAKWLMFPTIEAKKKKHYIEDKFEVENYVASMHDSIGHEKRYDS